LKYKKESKRFDSPSPSERREGKSACASSFLRKMSGFSKLTLCALIYQSLIGTGKIPIVLDAANILFLFICSILQLLHVARRGNGQGWPQKDVTAGGIGLRRYRAMRSQNSPQERIRYEKSRHFHRCFSFRFS
jgi:hypothetical protein